MARAGVPCSPGEMGDVADPGHDPNGQLLILHLLPEDLSRGAQSYARALRDLLDGRDGIAHRTLTLFDAPPAALQADIELGVKSEPGRSVGFNPLAALALRRCLHAQQPQVLVAHGGEPLKYAWAAHVPDVRLVYNKIGMFGFGDSATIRRHFHRMLVRRADIVAGVSREALAQIPPLVGSRGPELRLVPNGRDDSVYRPTPSRIPGPVRLLYVGQVSQEKRPDLFVEVAAALRRDGVEFDAALAGGGHVPEALSKAAKEAGVTLLGRRDDVPKLMAGSDVLVLTSDTEGMPGVVIEAGLCGLPVVATDVPGVSDVLVEGETGYVVARGDGDAIAAACTRLIHNPDLRSRLGTAARTRCVEHFSLETSARRWQALLNDLVARNPPRKRASAAPH